MNAIIVLAAVYGTLVGGELVNAPKVVNVGGYWRGTASLTEAQANAIGYKLVIDERPSCSSNEYAVAVGWTEADGRIHRVYRKQIAPLAIPTYSVADLTFWAATHGKVDALMAWLKAAEYYEVYLTTQTFAADNDVFGEVKSAVVAAGIVSEQELTEALEYARVN